MRSLRLSLAAASLAFMGVTASLALSGCIDDPYCFARCNGDSTTGGTAGTGGSTGGTQVGGFNPTGGTGGCDANTATDVKNCGECGNVCMLAGATAQCFLGKCEIDTCFDGKYDVDGDPSNGCEYTCVVPVPGPELCNGLDDDCDGLTDSDDPDLVPPPNFCTTTPGTPCENTQILCNGAAGWSCSYPAGVEVVQGFVKLTESKCDGIDGNCDGQIDEWFTDLGKPCSDMGVGQCKDFGLIVCDPQNAATTKCDLSFPPDAAQPGPEQCNGKDDDCNGLIDDNLPDEAFAMEPIPGTSPVVLVDRHEASRPDATLMTAGILETVACSRPMVLPWTGGGYPEAEAACASRGPGYRLCTAQELEKACRGAADTLYPYGDTYETLTCNGADQPVQGVVATGTLAACTVTGTQVTDLSGNVTEWTSTQTNADPAPGRIFQLHGGSYLSPGLGLACTIELPPRAAESTLLPNIGFRCCKD
ncbi:MAG: MopE-related protein [Polyangiaceae bacterium]